MNDYYESPGHFDGRGFFAVCKVLVSEGFVVFDFRLTINDLRFQISLAYTFNLTPFIFNRKSF